MLELKKGRPEDYDQRSVIEQAVYDFLDNLNIEYDRLDHEPAYTMEICSEIDKSLGALICKNLFLCNRQKTDFYLLMMPADKVFKTKELSKALGVSRLSFGDADKMQELLGTTPGSASVMGLLNDKENKVRLIIDKDVLQEEYFGCHPCVNTSSLRISIKDLTDKILPPLNHSYTVIKLFGEE
ncbi:MAG: prolyl-tRNA synthetase associated domain-containing protein [Clostridia bacterium]|nr:prolyl-tRNA synthetase associated domain-containing protein [Clostridia bacterium]